MNKQTIHPVIFFNNHIIQTEDIGGPEVNSIIDINKKNADNKTRKLIIVGYLINNIVQLCNTFMIKLIEDNICKDEVAYIVDFNNDFNIRDYLFRNLRYVNNDNVSILIKSNIIFILNQFIQFYCMYKLVYNEGVDLYKYLIKDTYNEEAPSDTKMQDKYVFCYSIMNNMLEEMLPYITECCNRIEIMSNHILDIYNNMGGI